MSTTKVKRIPTYEFTPEMQTRMERLSDRLHVKEPLELAELALLTLEAVDRTRREGENEVLVQGGAGSIRLKLRP